MTQMMTGTLETNHGHRLRVSVIMPVRNEAGYIRESLQSIFEQDYPQHLIEIIVADGMSTDGTREAIKEMQTLHPNLRLVDNPERIAPTGLNAAIAQAQGDVIVRVDGHCQIQADYIRHCVQFLTNEDIVGVGGPMETIGETGLAEAIALAMSSPFGVGGSAFRTVKDRKLFVDTVAFPAYLRETVLQAGKFDEELVRNQDDEYNFRLRKMGGRILLAPQIRSRYFSRSSFRSLWKQYFQYGFWKVRVMQKHPRQMSLRQFVPPVFVAAQLAMAVLALFHRTGRILLLFSTLAYALANLSASFFTAKSNRRRQQMPLLSLAFATLHVSYGAGFLTGLLKFAGRWKTGARRA